MSCCRLNNGNTGSTQVLGESEDGKIRYMILPENRLEESVKVLEEGFYSFEPVCSLAQLTNNKKAVAELNFLAIDMMKNNFSVAAECKETNQIVGVCVNKIQSIPKPDEPSYFQKFRDMCKEKQSWNLINYMIETDGGVDVFEVYGIDTFGECVFLSVLPSYRQRGIGFNLIHYSIKNFKSSGATNVACMIGTSKYTNMIAKKLDFKILNTGPIKYQTEDQKLYEEVTKVHDKFTLLLKTL